MSSNLTYYQLKIDGNKYKFLYVRLMVTTRQKSIGNTQKIKRKISKHTIRENDQTTNEERGKKETEELQNLQKKFNKMAISTYLSIITKNVNGLNLNSPIKRHRLVEWIKKQNSPICCLQETHIRCKNTHRLKVKR